VSSVIDLIESHDSGFGTVVPPVPESLEDTGIPPSIIEHLILKYLYFRGELLGREIGSLIGFPFSLIDETLETFKRQHYVAVKKSLGMGNMSGIFFLTETGRNLAREFLENNQYAGPAPVPLYQYAEIVRRQRLRENWLSPELLRSAFQHLVVEADILAQIGPRGQFEQVLPDLRAAR
jgi:DNA-binding MarR family transcriptional regulator